MHRVGAGDGGTLVAQGSEACGIEGAAAMKRNAPWSDINLIRQRGGYGGELIVGYREEEYVGPER